VRANGVAIHPNGKSVFISNGADGTVMAIDVASNKVTHTIKVGDRPWNMAITADGKKLYVANGRSNTVSVIDTDKLEKTVDLKVGEMPWGVYVPH